MDLILQEYANSKHKITCDNYDCANIAKLYCSTHYKHYCIDWNAYMHSSCCTEYLTKPNILAKNTLALDAALRPILEKIESNKYVDLRTPMFMDELDLYKSVNKRGLWGSHRMLNYKGL